MARTPRRPPSRKGKRDYAAEYRWRVRKTKPGTPARTRARGHAWEGRGQTRAFLAYLKAEDTIVLTTQIGSIEMYEDERGTERYRAIEKQVLPARPGRRVRLFTLRDLSRAELKQVIDEERRKGAQWYASPSLDQRNLLEEEYTSADYKEKRGRLG